MKIGREGALFKRHRQETLNKPMLDREISGLLRQRPDKIIIRRPATNIREIEFLKEDSRLALLTRQLDPISEYPGFLSELRSTFGEIVTEQK